MKTPMKAHLRELAMNEGPRIRKRALEAGVKAPERVVLALAMEWAERAKRNKQVLPGSITKPTKREMECLREVVAYCEAGSPLIYTLLVDRLAAEGVKLGRAA